MLSSFIYSFVHGCKTYFLYTFNPESYVAILTCYDREKDFIQSVLIARDLFADRSFEYIDYHVEQWFLIHEKKPSLKID